jgi:outer membrane protein assembly factor BamB
MHQPVNNLSVTTGNRMRCTGFVLVVCLAMPFCLFAADDWPQWRGQKRDGNVPVAALPESWPDALLSVWRIPVGEGHASPVLANEVIYVFSRVADDEVLRAVRPEDGQVIWREAYPAPYSMNSAARGHGKGPKSTPIVAGNNVMTLGITGVLTCHDTRDGAQRWQIESAEMFRKHSPLYGTAMSPLVGDGKCVAHLGGEGDGALIAVDIATGDVAWRWSGDGPAYTSPVLGTFGGKRQLVTFSQEHIIGIDFATGQLLWKLPFTTPWSQNAVTPLLFDGDLILSGLSQGIFRLRISRQNDAWMTEKVWQNQEIGSYMSTPVRHNNVILVFSDKRKGLYVSLDPKSGKILWQSEGRDGDNAALLHAGDYLMSLNTEGKFLVALQQGTGYRFIRTYDVSESPTWAHPVLFDRKLLIKNKTELLLFRIE